MQTPWRALSIAAETPVTERPARRSRTRRTARVLGVLIAAAGVLILLWAVVTWQLGDPITGLYTKWQQRALQHRLAIVNREFQPVRVQPSKPSTVTPKVTPKVTPPDPGPSARRLRRTSGPGDPLGRIHVGRLGLNMIFVDGTDHDSLKRGPGFDPRSHLPGEGELVYIAGHRTTYGAPFAHIDRLRVGDVVQLDMPYGRFLYRVSGHVIVPADDIARLHSRGREEIALQACHPRFSASERYIVYASPVKPGAS